MKLKKPQSFFGRALTGFLICFMGVAGLSTGHTAKADSADGLYLGRGYHMTASTSPNLSEIQIINTSDSPLSFTGTLYHKSGSQLGQSDVPLHSGVIASQGRLILSSSDLERVFDVLPWTGPAILDVTASGKFELMGKLYRNGRVTNSNCTRTGSAHNIEGTDAVDVSYLRFINIGSSPISYIRGTLYDVDGDIIGQPETQFFQRLAPREAIFLSQKQISNVMGDSWTGEASLVLDNPHPNLRLMNLNFVNDETFFNFSCYESSAEPVEAEPYPTELSGVWTARDLTVKLVFMPDGRYAAISWEDEDGQDGVEAGTYINVDETLVVTVDVNDDGDALLCGGDESNRCSTNNTWSITNGVLDINGDALLDKESLSGTGLTGVWELQGESVALLFEEDLTYMFIQYEEESGSVGYERGTYTKGTTSLNLTNIENNDGDALLCELDEGQVCNPMNVSYSLTGNTLTLFGEFVFTRTL